MDDLQAHVETILRSSRIRGKLVVLCEGDRLTIEDGQTHSPQMYRRLEKTPDSSFFKACVPANWNGYCLPHFFNCGGRSDVLRTFQALLTAHHEHPQDSYLTPEKLYAIVDLDIQAGRMPVDYRWRTTEDVHVALYSDGALRPDLDEQHRIFVTALIHKEAFFVLPATAAALVDGVAPPLFDGAPLDLRAVYAEAARKLAFDADLSGNLPLVKTRLERFTAGSRLECSSVEGLKTSWLTEIDGASEERYEALVRALLAIAKIKPLWTQIRPDPRFGGTLTAEGYREQLALKVGRAVAKLSPEAHPLAGLFAWLKARR